jgi:hypothetical protein
MMLEQLVYALESRLLQLGRSLWPLDPRARRQAEAERLLKVLQQRQRLLADTQAELDTVGERLTRNRTAAALLTAQVESCLHRGVSPQAYPHALELDRLRPALAADETALPRLEQRCWSLQFQVRQLERRLDKIHSEG